MNMSESEWFARTSTFAVSSGDHVLVPRTCGCGWTCEAGTRRRRSTARMSSETVPDERLPKRD